MNRIQIDILPLKDLEGMYKLNLYISGFCIQTTLLHNSDLDKLINEEIVDNCNKDRTLDGSGVLLTSKVYECKKLK
jgi:hypothetical protein